MPKLPSWLPTLTDRLDWGCSTSELLLPLAVDEQMLEVGRLTCFELWPFLTKLPDNVALVRDTLPPEMTSAIQLLSHLADADREYQRLYLDQCALIGIDEHALNSHVPSAAVTKLEKIVSDFCRSDDWRVGLQAVATAELSATFFCRTSLPHWQAYFERRKSLHDQTSVERGFAWLKVHADPQPRHALWLARALGYSSLESNTNGSLPDTVDDVLSAVFAMWRCPVNEAAFR